MILRRVFYYALLGALCFTSGCQRQAKVEATSRETPKPPSVSLTPIREDRETDDLARFLAGVPGRQGSPYEPLERTDGWVEHARETNRLWELFRTERYPGMTEFQKTELTGDPVESSTLFYPFGGPDSLTALTLFPQSRQYVLIGLEPPGTLPKWAQFHTQSLNKPLTRMRSTTYSLLARSFFITAEMDRQLRGQITDGVLPVVLTQIVRTGHRVIGYKYVTLDSNGQVIDRNPADKTATNRGVAIEFEGDNDHVRRQLLYFSVNLATDRLSKNAEFAAYFEKLPRVTSFFKSTSYMPHQPAFGLLRERVLSKSGAVVQDDSGIPFKFFEAPDWRVQLYGDYDKPFGSFRYLQQVDLKQAYQKKETVKKLTFPIGYGFKKIPSNLLVAKRVDTRAGLDKRKPRS